MKGRAHGDVEHRRTAESPVAARGPRRSINVHESAANWMDDQFGKAVMGRYLGTVVIGCGTK